ncbi:MAG: chemotaxis protein CheW [Deltaproteobacteria bacterium]|nr:chemotaxis protein CheW [Deltaproteobacteria bacterium]MBW2192834.1 chemotaxis protein CheW [Deltaproteobacteria bacterium]
MQVVQKNEAVESQKRQFCTFRIFGRLYGVDILDVKEINREIDITPIFHAPKEVKGYVNIRGKIYLLLDLRLILGFENKAVDDANRIVLFKPEAGEAFGVLADSIDDIVTIEEKQIENRRKKDQDVSDGTERRSVDIGEGVCRLENELLVILNARNLLKVIGSPKRHSKQ